MALIGVTGDQEPWPPVTPPQGGQVLKRYDVVINGFATTLLLSDADAAARGLTAAEPEPAAPPAKAKTAPNKSRTPKNKAP